MKHKVSLKVCFILCFISVIMSSLLTINADETMKEIKAYINHNLQIVKDGSVLNMSDVNGSRVYPITYNGTTYLPVRYIGNMVNLDVAWDGETDSVILTTNKKEAINLLKDIKVSTNLNNIISVEDCKLTLPSKEIIEYKAGLSCVLISNQDFKLSNYIGIPVLDSETVSFVGYSPVRTSINVFNQQGKLVKTVYLDPETPTYIEVSVEKEKTTLLYFVGVSQEETKSINVMKLFDIMGK